MTFYQYPEWSATIRTHHWHLRFARGFNASRIRKQYRLVVKEKKPLHQAGVDHELVRLLCRHMVDRRTHKAEQRFWQAHLKRLQQTLL
jgi:hypothetical protein